MTMDLTRRQLLQRASIIGAFSALASEPGIGATDACAAIDSRGAIGRARRSCLPAARLAPKNLDELSD
jgi:hypothetical protein